MSCELLAVLLNAMLIGAVVGYVSYVWHEYWNARQAYKRCLAAAQEVSDASDG